MKCNTKKSPLQWARLRNCYKSTQVTSYNFIFFDVVFLDNGPCFSSFFFFLWQLPDYILTKRQIPFVLWSRKTLLRKICIPFIILLVDLCLHTNKDYCLCMLQNLQLKHRPLMIFVSGSVKWHIMKFLSTFNLTLSGLSCHSGNWGQSLAFFDRTVLDVLFYCLSLPDNAHTVYLLDSATPVLCSCLSFKLGLVLYSFFI